MKTLVRLAGKGSSIVFSHDAPLKDVANHLSHALLHGNRGPLDVYGQYYRVNAINPYPTADDTNPGDFLVDVSLVGTNWRITTEEITGKNSSGDGVNTKNSKSFNGLNDFLDSFKAKQFVYEVGKLYVFKYNGGSNPGSTRFVKVEEVNPTGILCKDLALDDNDGVRNFLYSKIENPRKAG